MKVATIVGARPQFIKAATVSRVISETDGVSEILIHSGQHYDENMSDVFFEELGIPKPDYNLGIGGGRHGEMTGKMLEQIEAVLVEEKPDWVLVYGDTNSTLAGALAAVKMHIPVAHVEAGLRSFNRKMPEEINRVLTDHSATALFVPTDQAVQNLEAEGIPAAKVFRVGDVMYDAALFYSAKATAPSWAVEHNLEPGSFVLATVHRAENTDDPQKLKDIFAGLAASGEKIVFPLHPRLRHLLDTNGMMIPDNILFVDPVGYLEMIWLEKNCKSIATDSGGVQKEAYFSGKPCITMREETEWVELIEAGWNTLVGSDADMIAEAIRNAKAGSDDRNIYGDGQAAKAIVDQMIQSGSSFA